MGLYVDDSIPQCRICHEEEEKADSSSLETPCACSGTVKFAHRECIQRWCVEKGNTTCEICLQKFEPGYTIPKEARLADVAVTIRESLEVRRQGHGMDMNSSLLAIVATDGETLDLNYAECSPASERSSSCCRFVAVIFATLLLVRHVVVILTDEAEHYAFAVLTLLVLRAGGIILPLYAITRVIEVIQHLQRQQQIYRVSSYLEESEGDDDTDEEEETVAEHSIQIIP